MSKLRVIELFGGIGACSKAIERLGIPYEIADYVEIDKYAVKSFNAIHGTNFEPQDIKEWDKDIEADLIMHGSPCQDFSVAGKGAGGDKDSGTRSSLMYETLRIVEKIKPKYVIWENVKNLLSKKHIHNFEAYQEAMRELGYVNYYQVLNAKDYGIPQNRERVFTVSIRNDIWDKTYDSFGKLFEFPKPFPLEKKLKDILDDEVDEKYYLSEDRLDVIYKCEQRQKENGRGFRFDVKNGDSVGRAVTTGSDRPAETNYVKVERLGGLYDKDGQTHQAGSIYDGGGLSPTLSTMQGGNLEPMVVASRGRNVMNSNKTEQQLEPRKDGLTNTITSVQKENYVAEPTIVEDFYKSREPREYTENAPTLRADRQGLKVKTANKKGYDLAQEGDSIDLAYPNSTTRRGRVGHEVSKTLECSDTMGTLQNYRIRKLTPKECWRLMGFDDTDFEKAEKVNSNTQLYKQAGNSIVVNVLEGILKNLLENEYGR